MATNPKSEGDWVVYWVQTHPPLEPPRLVTWVVHNQQMRQTRRSSYTHIETSAWWQQQDRHAMKNHPVFAIASTRVEQVQFDQWILSERRMLGANNHHWHEHFAKKQTKEEFKFWCNETDIEKKSEKAFVTITKGGNCKYIWHKTPVRLLNHERVLTPFYKQITIVERILLLSLCNGELVLLVS